MVFPGGKGHVKYVARRGRWRISCTLCCTVSTIRAKHTNIFSDSHAAGKDNNEVLRMVLDHAHQLDLACCIIITFHDMP